jgi:hypothetical protein
MIHEFFLIKEANDYQQYADPDYLNRHIRKQSSVVKIHDDLVLYMWDTLQWIPSLIPAENQTIHTYGLNYYGITIINKEGSGIFYHVMESWANLFSKAPIEFKLTGSWVQDIDDQGLESTEGYYQKIDVPRDTLVNRLKTLVAYATEVSRGDYFILHWGI